MSIIGVTGSFGSGKTLVAGMFSKRGAVVFDADQTVHELFNGKGRAVREIIKAFDVGVGRFEGIDRARLARVVFNDPVKMKRLTDIVHPLVRRAAERFVRLNKKHPLLILDVPLLIESGWQDLVDLVVVVKAGKPQQLARVLKRSGISAGQAIKRMRVQMPLKEKLKYADYVVDNSGRQSDTDRQVQRIVEDLKTKGI